MNEPRKAGRPRKHLQDEHHFRTSDDAAVAGAPLAAADSGQADASDEALASDSASAELTQEAVVENPIVDVPLSPIFQVSQSVNTELLAESQLSAFAPPVESPVEQKIHDLVDTASLNGWHPIEPDVDIALPPRNGMAVRLSKTTEGEFVIAFWKRFRAFANATKRWNETGCWYDFHTGQKISFDPKYWKERF